MKKYLFGLMAILFISFSAFTITHKKAAPKLLEGEKYFEYISGSHDSPSSYRLTYLNQLNEGTSMGCASTYSTAGVCTVFASPVWDGTYYRPNATELGSIKDNSSNFTTAAANLTYLADE